MGTSACAHAQNDAAPVKLAGCTPISPESPQRQLIEDDIADFMDSVPASAAVRFEVQDCAMDGQLYNGKTIVLSARLARLQPAQRLFIIAHEFGHHQLDHQTVLGGALRRISAAARRDDPSNVPGATEIAHRTEFEADAYAVRMMYALGFDPEDAALLFDSLGAGKDNTTHPAFARRAQAIRAVRATLVPAATAQSQP